MMATERDSITHLNQIIQELKRKNLLSAYAAELLELTFFDIDTTEMQSLLINTRKENAEIKYPEKLESFAKTLLFLSSKAYEYVQSNINLALPEQSEVRGWSNDSMRCLPGYTKRSFDALQAKVQNSNKQIIVNLTMNAMIVQKDLEIDYEEQTAWGGIDIGTGLHTEDYATRVLILMVVSLNENWKMPIAYFPFYRLEDAIKGNIYREALIRLNDVGIRVASITCEGLAVGYNTLAYLGYNISDVANQITYIKHPVNDYKVHLIFDARQVFHFLRCICCVHKTFIDPEGNLVDFRLIIKLYTLAISKRMRISDNIIRENIIWFRQQKKTNFEKHTFSLHMVETLQILSNNLEHPDFQNVAGTVKFLKLMNSVNNYLHCGTAADSSRYKGSLNKENNLWRDTLNEALHYLSNCKDEQGNYLHASRKYNGPFIALIATIRSTINLVDEYVETGHIAQLYTYKMSQDFWHTLFADFRKCYGNINISVMEFYNTYKESLGQFIEKGNVIKLQNRPKTSDQRNQDAFEALFSRYHSYRH